MTGNVQLTEKQSTLLRQAKSCRDLAHFLRTDPRVNGHFDINVYFFGFPEFGHKPELDDIKQCGTTACAIGWGVLMGMLNSCEESQEVFGTDDIGDVWKHLFDPIAVGGDSERTPREEALVLEEHASKLEAQSVG